MTTRTLGLDGWMYMTVHTYIYRKVTLQHSVI
jgi:hypothetical protein